jgi:hypothetical protein
MIMNISINGQKMHYRVAVVNSISSFGAGDIKTMMVGAHFNPEYVDEFLSRTTSNDVQEFYKTHYFRSSHRPLTFLTLWVCMYMYQMYEKMEKMIAEKTYHPDISEMPGTNEDIMYMGQYMIDFGLDKNFVMERLREDLYEEDPILNHCPPYYWIQCWIDDNSSYLEKLPIEIS